MKALIGAAILAGTLTFSGLAASGQAVAAPQTRAQAAAISDVTDFSAHRRHYRRHPRYAYRPYYRSYYGPRYRPYYGPYYYDRPAYYRPYPYYAPAPFTFGIGFGPVWW
jgi:hypothetical protein